MAHGNLLGQAVEYLEEYRRVGKDHLCIVPHRAMHYYPVHLVGPAAHPLATDWVVTYLPNLRLLERLRGGPSLAPSRDFTAIGLNFHAGADRAVGRLEHADAEARAVAALFGTEPILGDDAKKRAVINAFEHSRVVHLATHGQHDPDAPALQSVLLAPGTDPDDGRLHAYEILGLDLRHIDLVTLAACETALGRFDDADNLRGLSASLFLAGVRAIVGTLWPIEDETGAFFFRRLYKHLRDGEDPLDCFAAAQRETRRAYPEYRDWGAFVYVGDWRPMRR
jgi:CHAT domain-containing protein